MDRGTVCGRERENYLGRCIIISGAYRPAVIDDPLEHLPTCPPRGTFDNINWIMCKLSTTQKKICPTEILVYLPTIVVTPPNIWYPINSL